MIHFKAPNRAIMTAAALGIQTYWVKPNENLNFLLDID